MSETKATAPAPHKTEPAPQAAPAHAVAPAVVAARPPASDPAPKPDKTVLMRRLDAMRRVANILGKLDEADRTAVLAMLGEAVAG